MYAMYPDAAVLQDSRNNTPVTQRFVRTKAGQAYMLSLSVQSDKFYEFLRAAAFFISCRNAGT